jgi:ADP-heptose:LPS heptosyltransferase
MMSPFTAQSKKKIAILLEGSIGDTLIALPSIRMLHEQLPETSFTLVSMNQSIELSAARILENVQEFRFSEVLFYENAHSLSTWQRFMQWLRVAAKLRSLGVKKCIYGIRDENDQYPRRAMIHRRIFSLFGLKLIGVNRAQDATWRLPEIHPDSIGAKLFVRICADLEIDTKKTHFDFRYRTHEEDQKQANELVASLRLTGKHMIAMCVSGKAQTQRWPIDRYCEVLQRLQSELVDTDILVFGSDEQSLEMKQLHAAHKSVFAIPKLPVGPSIALSQRCRFYLGNDTGPMHIAAAAGIPSVAIFGQRHLEGNWYPFGSNNLIITKDVSCKGCHLQECEQEKLRCLLEITPNIVIEKIRTFMKSLP